MENLKKKSSTITKLKIESANKNIARKSRYYIICT